MGSALNESDVSRNELFLTSKLHPADFGYESTLAKIESSLKDLQTNYLDLFLLHYSKCWGSICDEGGPKGSWEDSWKALEKLVMDGKVKDIGEMRIGLTIQSVGLALNRVQLLDP